MSDPQQGEIWRYDYLWRWQHDGGETEGRKRRPVALVAVVRRAEGSFLFLLPITSSPPIGGRLSVEITQMELRRAGLDDIPSWVMIDEYNFDRLETSYYFDRRSRVGRFGAAFHRRVLQAFLEAGRAQRVKRVPRFD